MTAEHNIALKHHDFSSSPFPPGYDRGRFPRERRKRGGTNTHPSRSSTLPISSAAMLAEPLLTATAEETSTNTNNLLPSRSPSIQIPPQSAIVIDLEDLKDEATGTRTVNIAPVDVIETEDSISKSGNEESEISAELERPLVPIQHSASTISDPIARITNSTHPLLNAEDVVQLSNEEFSIAHNQQGSGSATSGKPSEAASEPRKRKQTFPEMVPPASERIPPTALQDVSSTSLAAEMQNYYRKAMQRLHATNVPDRPGVNYERPRIGLLRAACENSDFFFLRLHQLFCTDAWNRRNGQVTPLEDAHRSGLEVLSYLLVSNENLSADAIEWFSSFPLPWHILHASRPAFHSANVKVLSCLVKLSSHWAAMGSLCKSRAYPPLAEEMITCFDIESFTFQLVVFLALLRQIWQGPQDHCYQLTEAVFPKNYKETMLRRSRNDPEDAHKAYSQVVVMEFQSIALCHRTHLQQQAYQRNSLPSGQGQAVPVETSRNETHHDPRSLSTNPTRQGLQAIQSISSTFTPSPSSAHPHSRPPVIPGSLPIQYRSPFSGLAINTATNSHNNSLNQSTTMLQSLQAPSIPHGYQSPHHLQNQQTIFGHSSSASRVSSSMPSEIMAHQILPSNVPNQGATHITPQVPPPAHRHSSYINPHPPPLPWLQNEAQPSRLEWPRQPQAAQTPQRNPTQFIRANPNLNQIQPNPTWNALHQAHVRSPILSVYDLEGKSINMKKTFRYIKQVIMPPGQLSRKKLCLHWTFNIEKALADTLARDTPGSDGSPPRRTLVPGTRLCRVRCIRVNKAHGIFSPHEWVVSENVWHTSTAIVLNGSALEIRKKSHHGKDLPIDVTSYIREGMNSISTAVIGFSADSIALYAIGIEIIEVIEEQLLKRGIAVLPGQEACARMIDRSKSVDPEVLVVDAQLVIDLKDPFSAQIFEVPVRGTHCRHNECFDRDIFLETRNSTRAEEPCQPDAFRCPICGADARPQNLVIDGFLVQVREKLQQTNRLDAKAIVLRPSGEWDIKEEEELMGEKGDGTGRWNAPRSRPSMGGQSSPREVIHIDDG